MAADDVPNKVVPNPDPSIITMAMIDRSVGNSEEKIYARIDGIEKAIVVFNDNLTRVPTQLDRAIAGVQGLLQAHIDAIRSDVTHIEKILETRDMKVAESIGHLKDLVLSRIEELRAVTNEKFAGVNSQFEERDTRTDQRAGDTKLAVDAAFAAAKEATAKIEAGFTKQIDAQADIIDTKTQNSEDKIADLKDRITAMEARTVGISASKTETRLDNGTLISIIAVLTSIMGVVFVYTSLHH